MPISGYLHPGIPLVAATGPCLGLVRACDGTTSTQVVRAETVSGDGRGVSQGDMMEALRN